MAGGTGRYGLIGEHLGHSFSPAIHRQLAGYDYRLIELAPEAVGPFLREGAFDGLNVTIPYKKAVIPYLSELSDQARRTGSVNTIVRRRDGTLYGDNTDYDGFRYLLAEAGIDPAGKKALILGSGGASATVRAVLEDMGAASVVVISRSGADNYHNLDRHRDAAMIINTTPVGMYPHNGVSPVDLAHFPCCEGVADLIYNPARTALLLDAERRGIRRANGLGMLVAQAKVAAERFLDTPLPDRRIGEIARRIEWETRNLMLIGMPGCGKSTVGRLLAERLGRPFVDLDSEIERLAGHPVPTIFAEEGETGFRRWETQALAAASRESGQIIACGGGIVTRPENEDLMRQNSTIVCLRRPLDRLPTDGRPLSQAHSPEALYRQRAPLYARLADLTADNTGTPEATADIILGRLMP